MREPGLCRAGDAADRPAQEAQGLGRRLAGLVNAAYGLTAAEVDLLWQTAPPRMPVGEGGVS